MYNTKVEALKPCCAAVCRTVMDNIQTWTVSSLTDFSLHIHPPQQSQPTLYSHQPTRLPVPLLFPPVTSPPPAVSAHTLQSPTYTSSCPSPVPSCYCPADGCAATLDVWFHSGKVEMFVHVVKNVVFLWFVGNHVTFGIPNRILRDTGTEIFNPNKAGTAPRKQRKKKSSIGESYACTRRSTQAAICSSATLN